MSELPEVAYAKIKQLCAEGDDLADAGDYSEALSKYWSAWDQLPSPQTTWQAATWILGAVGDTNFLAGDFEAGRENLSYAMQCPDGLGNAFLHLRLGQCCFELGELDQAAEHLARAFLTEGKRIFSHADDKYLHFVKSRLQPPLGGWPAGY